MKTPLMSVLTVWLFVVTAVTASENSGASSQANTPSEPNKTQQEKPTAPLVAPKQGDNFDEKPLHEYEIFQIMLKRNNQLRATRNLKPHELSPELVKAAQDHAWYMARTGNFSHYSNLGPQGRARKYGFNAFVRENIGWGYKDVNRVFNGWRNSGAHWSAIISNTKLAGFGYAISKSGNPYWVAVYGNAPVDKQPAESAGTSSPMDQLYVVYYGPDLGLVAFNPNEFE